MCKSSCIELLVAASRLLTLTLVAVACDDDVAVHSPQSPMTQPPAVSPAAVRARVRLDENNPRAWIGVAHNAALRDLQSEIAAPGVPKSLCRMIADFASRVERVPTQRRLAGHLPNQIELRRDLEIQVCTSTRPHSRTQLVAHTPAPARRESLDEATNQLLAAVEAAIEEANDRYDLANRLDPILTAATILDSVGRSVVEVAVSIAQSSVENAEIDLPKYVSLVESEYGACAESYLSAGYSLDDSRYLCTEGKDRLYEMTLPATVLPPARVASLDRTRNTSRKCVGLTNGWKRVGKMDVKTGIAGFISGLVKTKSLGGAGVYALAGSVGGSGGEYLVVAFEMWQCAME